MDIKLTDWKVQLVRVMFSIEKYENLPRKKISFYSLFVIALLIYGNGGFLAYLLNLDELNKKDQKRLKISPFGGWSGMIVFYGWALLGKLLLVPRFTFLQIEFENHWYHGFSILYYFVLGYILLCLIGIVLFVLTFTAIYFYKKLKSFICLLIVLYLAKLPKKENEGKYINYKE